MVLIFIIVVIMILFKKYINSAKIQNIILLIAALSTVVCHYSSLLYHYLNDGSAIVFLKGNPNLILRIYPCNVVMWSCIIYGFSKNKNSKFNLFLTDYIFWFGLVSSLVGMLVNIDFLRNPTLKNYDVTKGIVAHAIMLLNVLLLPLFGRITIKLEKM